MIVDQTFEEGSWLGGKKSQTYEPSTFKVSIRHQNHVKMNVRILGDVIVM
jgi:hypothetical protein